MTQRKKYLWRGGSLSMQSVGGKTRIGCHPRLFLAVSIVVEQEWTAVKKGTPDQYSLAKQSPVFRAENNRTPSPCHWRHPQGRQRTARREGLCPCAKKRAISRVKKTMAMVMMGVRAGSMRTANQDTTGH
nr:hypothetical protein [Pandoravirus massiliensis]